MDFQMRGNRRCNQAQGSSTSECAALTKKKCDSTSKINKKEECNFEYLKSRKEKDSLFDEDECNKPNFSDQNFINHYIQGLEKQICKLQSITEPSVFPGKIKNPVPCQKQKNVENLCQEYSDETGCSSTKLPTRKCSFQPVEQSKKKIDERCSSQTSTRNCSCQPLGQAKKKIDPNKLRYDKTCLNNSCAPDKFPYTLKPRDWEAEFEERMHQEMPPLDLPSWPPGSCGPPQNDGCEKPKCQLKMPLRKDQMNKKPICDDDMSKLIADYNRMKESADKPPLPPNRRTVPSYSFLYEDVPLAVTLMSKKSFDQDCNGGNF